MRTNYLKPVTAILALGIAAGVFGQESASKTRHLTLSEAIQLALKLQPDLYAAKAQASAANAQLKQAKAAFLPTLTANLTTNDGYTDRVGGNSSITSVSSVTATRQADLVLSYKLLDSGQRLGTQQSAAARLQSAHFSEDDQRQTIIAGTATAYYELLRQSALVDVQTANVKRTEAVLSLTQAQVKEGTQAKKDLYQAQADNETAKVNLLNAQNNLAVAMAQLKQVLGLADDSDLSLTDISHDSTQLPTESRTLDELLTAAYAQRPDLKSATANVERDAASVRVAKANNGVTLSVDTNLSAVFLQDQSNSRAIALTASLPLFNGGANAAAIKQAEETKKATQAQLASAKLAARVEVETAYRTLKTAQASVPASRSAQEAAQINYDAATESLKEGVGTIVDVITAQSQLVTAQTNYVQALYTLYTANASLLSAIGQADRIQGGAQ